MNLRFQRLSDRCRVSHGREAFEPGQQDGVSCQLLAALDQIEDAGVSKLLPTRFTVDDLRALVRSWLVFNDSIIVADWTRDDLVSHQELGLLREFGSDYSDFIEKDNAQGNHVVAFAICGVLSELTGRIIEAEVRATSETAPALVSHALPHRYSRRRQRQIRMLTV